VGEHCGNAWLAGLLVPVCESVQSWEDMWHGLDITVVFWSGGASGTCGGMVAQGESELCGNWGSVLSSVIAGFGIWGVN